jgi:hypothetical protein
LFKPLFKFVLFCNQPRGEDPIDLRVEGPQLIDGHRLKVLSVHDSPCPLPFGENDPGTLGVQLGGTGAETVGYPVIVPTDNSLGMIYTVDGLFLQIEVKYLGETDTSPALIARTIGKIVALHAIATIAGCDFG